MTRVTIIGAGIVGSTLSWVLAREGADVTLIDGGGDIASDGSLAWLNASSTSDAGYAAIRADSVRMWKEIAADDTCPVTFNGSLMWGFDEQAAKDHSEMLADLGWRCIPLMKPELEAMTEGMNAPDIALLSPDEGYANPLAITSWMRSKAVDAGAQIVPRKVSDLKEIDADHVVICAGNGCTDLLPDLPLRRSPGIVMRTAPCPPVIPSVMASPQLDFWQGADGVIAMSCSLSKTSERADRLMADDATKALNEIFPNLNATVVETIRRDRPIPKDGFPMVGRWGDFWVAAMHSGMTLAPVMAQALADKILGRPERFDITRYRPDREMGAHEKGPE